MYSFVIEVVIISWLCSRVYLYMRSILYNTSPHFIYCLSYYLWLSIFYWISNFIDLALNVFYLLILVCVSSFLAFLSFYLLAFVGFFYHVSILFVKLSCLFFLTISISHQTLHLVLSLVAMHSAAFMWAVIKFSYFSFWVCLRSLLKSIEFVPWIPYILLISVLVSADQL